MNIFSELIFVDTTAWLAYIDEHNPNHEKAVAEIQAATGQLVTSDYVLSSLPQHNNESGKIDKVNVLIRMFCEQYSEHLLRVTEEEEFQAWEIFRQCEDLYPSFVECTSLIILSSYNIRRWLSFSTWLPQTPEEVHVKMSSFPVLNDN